MEVHILFSAPLHRLKLVNLLENVSYTREELINAIEASLVYLCHYREGETPMECCGVGRYKFCSLFITFLIRSAFHRCCPWN